MLPIPPGCPIDVNESVAAHGDTPDGTTGADGWGLFSGTSAAAPQLAGAAAVILGARAGLAPAQVTKALVDSAVDVRHGRCHPRFNYPAGPRHDRATGAGLVNVAEAVKRAQGMLAGARTMKGGAVNLEVKPKPIRELMEEVGTIAPSATALEAATRLEERPGPLAVVKGGEVAGVVAARDIVDGVLADGGDPERVKVDRISTKDVETARSDEDVAVAEEAMVRRRLDQLLVVGKDNSPVGTISAAKILWWRRFSNEPWPGDPKPNGS